MSERVRPFRIKTLNETRALWRWCRCRVSNDDERFSFNYRQSLNIFPLQRQTRWKLQKYPTWQVKWSVCRRRRRRRWLRLTGFLMASRSNGNSLSTTNNTRTQKLWRSSKNLSYNKVLLFSHSFSMQRIFTSSRLFVLFLRRFYSIPSVIYSLANACVCVCVCCVIHVI